MCATHLAALPTLALLGAPVHPVVLDGGLLAVLPHAHVAERRFAREVLPVQQDRDAARVGHDPTRGALESWSMPLQHTNQPVRDPII